MKIITGRFSAHKIGHAGVKTNIGDDGLFFQIF
jgi:hypothetical protein